MATMMPAAGSAYTYSYAVLGETIAWVVGWSLILEYSLACSGVAVGWSGYLVGLIESAGIHLPQWMLAGPHGGGLFNLPAVLVSVATTAVLLAYASPEAYGAVLAILLPPPEWRVPVTVEIGRASCRERVSSPV